MVLANPKRAACQPTSIYIVYGCRKSIILPHMTYGYQQVLHSTPCMATRKSISLYVPLPVGP